VSRKFKSLLNLTTLAADPIGSVGDVFFNTEEKALKIHNGLIWITIASNTDPAPFYMHTHTFDGDVHTIDIENPITFKEINNVANVAEISPTVIGFDGGRPVDNTQDPSLLELSLLDGGKV
jgi:hypothetical protein